MKFQKTKPRYINRFQKPWKYAIWSKYEIGSIRMYRIVSQIWESRHATLISIYFMLQNDFKSIKWKRVVNDVELISVAAKEFFNN